MSPAVPTPPSRSRKSATRSPGSAPPTNRCAPAPAASKPASRCWLVTLPLRRCAAARGRAVRGCGRAAARMRGADGATEPGAATPLRGDRGGILARASRAGGPGVRRVLPTGERRRGAPARARAAHTRADGACPRQFDAADKFIASQDAGIPAEWRTAWENEKAALAWHRGRFDEARKLWDARCVSRVIRPQRPLDM